ncbi:MAG: hypothetical protein AB1568_02065 [Thermodesulfobacteriota bacterium]
MTKRGKIDGAGRMLLLAVGFGLLCCGCASSVSSSLIDMEARVSLPWLEPSPVLPVIYPGAGESRPGDDLQTLYGPAWKDVQGQYPEYRFN